MGTVRTKIRRITKQIIAYINVEQILLRDIYLDHILFLIFLDTFCLLL
jgi:hypothetical protein